MKRFRLYVRGALTGHVYHEDIEALDADAAKSVWERRNSVRVLPQTFLAFEELGASFEVLSDLEARVTELLEQQQAKAPKGLLPEARIDRTKNPINAEEAMRAVRLACGGDPDRRQQRRNHDREVH